MRTTLPETLADIVEAYMAESGDDFSSAPAMEGQCEDHSIALTRYIGDADIATDEYGHPTALIEAGAVQVWMDGVPEELLGNEMAGGHFVVHVSYDADDAWGEYEIDLTAAQFPELGWTGPRARQIR